MTASRIQLTNIATLLGMLDKLRPNPENPEALLALWASGKRTENLEELTMEEAAKAVGFLSRKIVELNPDQYTQR